jgi:glucokinase
MKQVVIGVDLGGTNVRIGIVTRNGRILKKVQYPTDFSEGRSAFTEQLVLSLGNLIDRTVKNSYKLVGIGIGAAGAIDMKKGIIVHSPNIPYLNGFPLKTFLERRISVPVAIENDANAFTIGEGWVGAAKGSKHYCGITLGTGVGGGIVIAGEILHGATGMAGEVGHMVITPEGLLCGCGGRGCLEVYASGTAISRMALEAIEGGEGEEILKRSGGNPEEVTSERVFEAARYGDLTAKRILDEMGKFLGLGLVNLIHLFNPEKIVIGGKVAQAWKYFIGSTLRIVQDRAMKGMREKTKIVRAKCGDDAGILGAAFVSLKGKRILHSA